MAQLVRDRQRPQRTDRIDEQRVRPVEGIDVTAARDLGPPPGLDRAAELQRQFVEVAFPGVFRDPAFAHQPQQVAVGADVVEAVIVDAHVAHVRGHLLDRVAAADLQELGLVRGVELQHGRTVLEALRPFRPAAGRIFPGHRENGRAGGRIVAGLDRQDLLAR